MERICKMKFRRIKFYVALSGSEKAEEDPPDIFDSTQTGCSTPYCVFLELSTVSVVNH